MVEAARFGIDGLTDLDEVQQVLPARAFQEDHPGMREGFAQPEVLHVKTLGAREVAGSERDVAERHGRIVSGWARWGEPGRRRGQRTAGWLRSRAPDSRSNTWYCLKASHTRSPIRTFSSAAVCAWISCSPSWMARIVP